ncbi:zinc finger protein 583 [Drosophila serrata]|uniref:zinc finger protein 583 n=1 Tax=Drosophila serrata TaxID=7274 RepID=UPI000A1D1C30|nr:zinc finger protein 583 [Drosophila serrata]
MENLCRICGTHSITLVGIFDQRQRRQFKGEVEPNLADMVKKCAEVQIDSGDPLPQKICRNCIQDAQIAYRFKRRCEQSYQKFYLAIANQPEIKKESKDPGDHFIIEEHFDNAVDIKLLVDIREESFDQTSTKKELPKMVPGQPKKVQQAIRESSKEYQNSLLEHNKIQKKSCTCQTCGESFMFETDLDKHLCFSISDPTVECPICLKVFSTSRGLDIHKCQPMKKRPFECPHCPQTFTHNHYLKAHLLIHPADETGQLAIGPHKCTMCRAGFANKASLKVHVRTHLEERPHSCPICASNFRSKQALKVHIRTHTGEKPYQCPHCPKTFSDNNNLAKHRRRHSDERPYKCLICLQDFREKHHLKRHVLSKHRDSDGEQPLK